MGIYMNTTAMIGVKFTPVVEVVETKQRGCEHPEIPDGNFCSVCGEPVWKNNSSRNHQFDDLMDEFIDPVLEKLVERFDGYAVVEPDHGWENVFVGYGLTVEPHETQRAPVLWDEHIIKDLDEVLGEFGVWEQCKDSFGLWAVSTGH